MMKLVPQGLKTLLSGGAAYVFMALFTGVLILNWQVKTLKQQKDEIKTERDQALKVVAEKDSVIASQSRQFSRREQHKKEQDDAYVLIQSLPDNYNCYESPPIDGAFEWLRQREAATQSETDHD